MGLLHRLTAPGHGLLTRLALAAALFAGLSAAASAAPTSAANLPSNFAARSLLLPPPKTAGRIPVTVALHVLNLSSIEEVSERFRLTGYLLAHWRDPRLAYQPVDAGDIYRSPPLDSIWRPRLVIINTVVPRQTFDTSLRVLPDGAVTYIERFDAQAASTFHLRAFPFDSQQLEILIHPFTDQQHYVSFVSSNLPVWTATEFNSYSSLESWQFEAIDSSIGTAGSQFGPHAIAEARFEIRIKRRHGFYLWKVFLPLLLMVIVSWSVFWFDPPEVSSQVTIAVTTILTIIAFALAISLTLPRVPYLTFADAFFLTCYIFAFMTMVEVTAVHIAYRSDQRKLAMRIRRGARWQVPLAFIVINLIVIAHFLG